jgi:dihydroorotase
MKRRAKPTPPPQPRSVRLTKHYRLPPNEKRITLEKSPWTAPEGVRVADEKALVCRGGEVIEWKVMTP